LCEVAGLWLSAMNMRSTLEDQGYMQRASQPLKYFKSPMGL